MTNTWKDLLAYSSQRNLFVPVQVEWKLPSLLMSTYVQINHRLQIHRLLLKKNSHKSWAVSPNKPFAESVKCDITFYRPRTRLLTDTAVLAETLPWVSCTQSAMFIFTLEHLKPAFKKCLLIRATEIIHWRVVSDFLLLFYCSCHINSADSRISTVYYAAVAYTDLI